MRAILDMTRERISTLLEEGYSSRTITFHVKVNHATVLKIKYLKERTGGLDVLPRPGQPKILTQCHERKIARFFKSGKCSNIVQAQKKLVSEE
ncbi:10607_t:CDS:1, partial [Racocetra persica]